MSSHKNEDLSDPVEAMLQKTGCIKLHYQVQECIVEKQDWRKCQEEVEQFRQCMEVYNTKRQQEIQT